MRDNYKIFEVLRVAPIVCFMQCIKVLDTICILLVLLLKILL